MAVAAHQLARLVDAVNRTEPAAIGLNVLMPEADALVARTIAVRSRPCRIRSVAAALRSLPSNDAVLARRSPSAPAVLAFAGPADAVVDALARSARHGPGHPAAGDDAAEMAVVRHAGRADQHRRARTPGQRLRPDLGRAHARHRPPHPARRHRRARSRRRWRSRCSASRYDAPVVRLTAAGGSVRPERRPDDLRHDRERDGAVRVYYSQRIARIASSRRSTCSTGRVDPERCASKLVLIGATGVRPSRDSGHAARRADVGQRDPRAAAREPVRRHAAAPAALGAGAPRRLFLVLRRAAGLGDAPAASAQRRIARARARRALGAGRASASTVPQRLLLDAATPA